MVPDNSATTSPANTDNSDNTDNINNIDHIDDETPPAATERIPDFFVDVGGKRIKVSHRFQEIPLDHPNSSYMFCPVDKPFVATTAIHRCIPFPVIMACLQRLIAFAKKHDGLDYLQIFDVEGSQERIWFIDDGGDAPITALFPSDY
jgi:hypothetical protein